MNSKLRQHVGQLLILASVGLAIISVDSAKG
jgi:hypothetical protein